MICPLQVEYGGTHLCSQHSRGWGSIVTAISSPVWAKKWVQGLNYKVISCPQNQINQTKNNPPPNNMPSTSWKLAKLVVNSHPSCKFWEPEALAAGLKSWTLKTESCLRGGEHLFLLHVSEWTPFLSHFILYGFSTDRLVLASHWVLGPIKKDWFFQFKCQFGNSNANLS